MSVLPLRPSKSDASDDIPELRLDNPTAGPEENSKVEKNGITYFNEFADKHQNKPWETDSPFSFFYALVLSAIVKVSLKWPWMEYNQMN